MHPDVERLLQQLDRSSPVARAHADDIVGAVATSPYLQDRIAAAVHQGMLDRVRTGTGFHDAGHYDSTHKEVWLDNALFASPNPRERRDGVAFVLGHEVGHALMHTQNEHKERALTRDINNLLVAPDGERVDATPLARWYIDRSSVDESAAEVVGWNALQSRVAHESNGHVDVSRLLARANPFTSCVVPDAEGHLRPAPGLALQADGRILVKDHPAQLEAMGQCHFETGSNLGPKGDASYRNYYGAYVVSSIATAALAQRNQGMATPAVALDFAALGFRPDVLGHAGLDFAGEGETFQVWDISHSPAGVPMVLHATANAKSAQAPEAVGAQTARDPLLQSVQEAVSRLDVSLGRAPDVSSSRTTASLYALAREHGLTQVDHVVLSVDNGRVKAGENIFAVQGGLTDPTNRVTTMKTSDAVAAPEGQSFARAAAVAAPEPAAPAVERDAPAQRVAAHVHAR